MAIKLVLLDIDGVLTDGKVTVDSDGNESKTIDFKDIDAVVELRRRGFKVGLLTGESTPITQYFKMRFKPDFFYNGCKDKAKAINEILKITGSTVEEVCFVGDSKHDIEAIKMIKHSACPLNAIPVIKAIASVKLKTRGGDGCILELLEWIIDKEKNQNG